MESPPSTPLTLVPAHSASRRRRNEDGELRRRRRSRSRDRDRSRRASPPPADWRGPTGPTGPTDYRPPPTEWAGMAGYAPQSHMGWPPPQRPSMYRPPGYGPWHVPPPREPMDWRPPAGAPGTWTPPSATAPTHWGGAPPPHWSGPAPYAKGPFENPRPAVVENGHSAGPPNSTSLGAPEPVMALAAPVEEPLPPALTTSERLRSVRLVASALSEPMLDKLHSLGVMPKKGKEVMEKAADALRSESASAQCDLLGLSFGSSSSRLPIGKRRTVPTPVCTLGLAPGGLWERFRQRCGTPIPPEPPSFTPQLRSSKVGGHVVVLAARSDAR